MMLECETILNGVVEVFEKSFNSYLMGVCGSMHVLSELINKISHVWTCQG